jgi:DNA-binding PadR family transcriptional regulator
MVRRRSSSRQTLLLLGVMLERPRSWRHGYHLSSETGLQSGTLYPILMRLCDRDLLESKWGPAEHAGRPPRHLYRLTSNGVAFAKSELAEANPNEMGRFPKGNPA